MIGDINGDGTIDIYDVATACSRYEKLLNPFPFYLFKHRKTKILNA